MVGAAVILFLVLVSFPAVYPLNLQGTEEGPCLENVPVVRDLNPYWLDTLPFINAGSKYHLYRASSAYPQFKDLRDFEFYYEACFVRNTSLIDGNGSTFGFGGKILGSFDVVPAWDQDPDAIMDSVPNMVGGGGHTGDFVRQKVTLTDYRTFAVLVNCWMGANQRSWEVVSMIPEMLKETKKRVEDHVRSLGFDRDKAVFLEYNDCENMERALRHRGNQTYKQQEAGRLYRGGSNKLSATEPSTTSASPQERDSIPRVLPKPHYLAGVGDNPPTGSGKRRTKARRQSRRKSGPTNRPLAAPEVVIGSPAGSEGEKDNHRVVSYSRRLKY